MTDRELLEAAAKAYGIALEWDDEGMSYYWESWRGLPQKVFWHSLGDDGDALRLATKLCMSVSTGPCQATANTIAGALRGDFCTETTVAQDQDKAVRRAITRAAAAETRARADSAALVVARGRP